MRHHPEISSNCSYRSFISTMAACKSLHFYRAVIKCHTRTLLPLSMMSFSSVDMPFVAITNDTAVTRTAGRLGMTGNFVFPRQASHPKGIGSIPATDSEDQFLDRNRADVLLTGDVLRKSCEPCAAARRRRFLSPHEHLVLASSVSTDNTAARNTNSVLQQKT